MLPEFKLLNINQCLGKDKLKLFDKIDLSAELTDFAILLGANVIVNENQNKGYYLIEDERCKEYSCIIGVKEHAELGLKNDASVGFRLTVDYDQIKDYVSNEKVIEKDLREFEFGYYPIEICDYEEQARMEEIFLTNLSAFEKTDNYHSIFETGFDIMSKFKNYYIYKFENERYIRYRNYDVEKFTWIKVLPIKWLMSALDENIAVTEKILFPGYVFSRETMNDEYLEYYINELFAEQIVQETDMISVSYLDDDEFELIKENGEEPLNNQNKFNYPHLKFSNKNYGIYLTDNTYKNNPAIGREVEIRELSKNLLIPKTGVILVGDAGVGKTAIVEGLAYQIQQNKVCDSLKNTGILSVNVGELLAGCNLRGDFEEKITKLCNSLYNSGNIILFLDEMHMSLGAGTAIGQNIDMANMLKTYISNDQIKVIGCTTREEFEEYFSNDKAFRRRFNIIDVKEPNEFTLNAILNSTINNLANKFNIKINLSDVEIENIISLIIKLSSRKQKYIYDSYKNPDASIKILTNCFAYFAIEDLKEVTYQDFINGIIDNQNLNLSKMEINNGLFDYSNDTEEIYDNNRQKVFKLSKKGN